MLACCPSTRQKLADRENILSASFLFPLFFKNPGGLSGLLPDTSGRNLWESGDLWGSR